MFMCSPQFNNTWKYVKTEETDCEESLCKNERYENGTVKAREYEAWLSVRKDETVRFHIKFSKGSHMRFAWMLDEDLGDTVQNATVLANVLYAVLCRYRM